MIINLLMQVADNPSPFLELTHYNVEAGSIASQIKDGVRMRFTDGSRGPGREVFVVSFGDLERLVEAVRVVRDGK